MSSIQKFQMLEGTLKSFTEVANDMRTALLGTKIQLHDDNRVYEVQSISWDYSGTLSIAIEELPRAYSVKRVSLNEISRVL